MEYSKNLLELSRIYKVTWNFDFNPRLYRKFSYSTDLEEKFKKKKKKEYM